VISLIRPPRLFQNFPLPFLILTADVDGS
jgi:hypothetical protein